MSDRSNDVTGRRDVLRAAAGAGCAAGTAAVATPAAAQEDDLDSWFEDVDNYDGVADRTDEETVAVAVGAEGNGGDLAFDPAAIRVAPGATVVWEWTGDGGDHDVVAEDDSFESERTGEEGFTFEHTFEDEGVYRYICVPHEAVGMKGAVVVGDADVEESGGFGLSPGVGAVGASLLLGLLSPIAFAAFLARRSGGRAAGAPER